MSDKRKILVLCCAAIVLFPLLFYAGMIFGGKEPAAPDTIAVRPLGAWARAAEKDLGATPQWIPFIFSGMPSYGSYVYTPASAASPLDWFLRPLAASRGMRYYVFFLLGGFSAFLLFRRQGVSDPAAAAAALAFVLTPYMTGVIEAGHSTKLRALMHAPLVLLAVDYFLSRPGATAAAFFALSTAMLGWSNHPQILYYIALICAIQVLSRLVIERAQWPKRRLALGAAWGIGGMAVAILLLAEPTLAIREYIPYSIRGASDAGGASWEYATGWSFPPKELISFLFPEFYGLKGGTYFGMLPFTQSTHYFGIVFLALVILGFVRRRSPRSWTWMAISGVLLLVGFGGHFPVLYKPFFEVLPYFDKFRVPSMIYALLPLTLGFLLCSSIDQMATPVAEARPARKERGSAKSSPDRRWVVVGVAAAAMAVIVLLAGLATASSSSGLVREGEAARIPAAQLAALATERAQMRTAAIARGLFLLGLLFAAVPWARRLRPPVGAAVLGALMMVDVLIVGAKFVDLVAVERLEEQLAPTAEVRTLGQQPGPFRVLPLDDFGSNRFAAYGIESLGGYQPAKLKVYHDIIAGDLVMSPPVLAMLNARYLLTSRDLEHPRFRKVTDGVFEYLDALPRAWFVESWSAPADPQSILRALGAESFDPGRNALLAVRPSGIPESGLPVRVANFARVDAHTIRIGIEGDDGPGLLVVSEIHYPPGWRATIDGHPAEILQANHCLRAVVVPPGARTVEMRYESQAFARGRTLNRIGVALLLVVGAGGYLLDRRRTLARSA